MSELNELSRESKIMLYTIGACNDLRDKGLLAGGFTMSEAGRAGLAELRASGFKPTDEAEEVVKYLERNYIWNRKQ